MDYRNRCYFLVGFHHDTRQLRMQNIKNADSSAKWHPPYNHIREDTYDGEWWALTGLKWPTAMLSCDKSKVDAVVHELKKTVGEDYYSGYFALNPYICKQ